MITVNKNFHEADEEIQKGGVHFELSDLDKSSQGANVPMIKNIEKINSDISSVQNISKEYITGSYKNLPGIKNGQHIDNDYAFSGKQNNHYANFSSHRVIPILGYGRRGRQK